MLIVYRYLPHLFVVAVASAGIAYAGFHVREGVRRELEPKIARLEAELAAERADRKRSEAASSAYQAELADLRNRPVPRASVRLCRAPTVPTPGKAPGGADGQELCVPSERLLLAQELELKRNALIDWIEKQMGVENKP